jgi:hypothetical protein
MGPGLMRAVCLLGGLDLKQVECFNMNEHAQRQMADSRDVENSQPSSTIRKRF